MDQLPGAARASDPPNLLCAVGHRAAFCVDAIGACLAGLLGLSPVVVFIESAVGVEIGGRTGLVAVVGALGFALTIIFNPILSSIPPWATGENRATEVQPMQY